MRDKASGRLLVLCGGLEILASILAFMHEFLPFPIGVMFLLAGGCMFIGGFLMMRGEPEKKPDDKEQAAPETETAAPADETEQSE